MSLVNDMLRDLDQRRKGTDGSSGHVKLTPASDYPSDKRRFLLPVVLVALLLTSGAIWYYLVQLSPASIEQQLDIQLGPALAESTSTTVLIAQQPNEAVPQASEPVEPQTSPVERQSNPVESQAAPLESQANPVESQVSPAQLVTSDPEATSSQEQEQSNGASERPVLIENDLARQISEPAEPTAELSAEVVSEVQPEEAEEQNLLADEGSESESVKDAAEFTSEQLDKIAVQEALQLIADGQTNEAYTVLGDHIESNRYASQSREFYAQLLMSQGRTQSAYELVDAGLTLAPNHQGFKKVKARLLLADGKIEEAVEILISRAPDISLDTEYHELLASAQLVARDYAGALISYRSLVEQDQSQGKWWYGYALSQDRLGNSSAARRYYGQAIQYSNLSANLRRRSQDRLSALNP